MLEMNALCQSSSASCSCSTTAPRSSLIHGVERGIGSHASVACSLHWRAALRRGDVSCRTAMMGRSTQSSSSHLLESIGRPRGGLRISRTPRGQLVLQAGATALVEGYEAAVSASPLLTKSLTSLAGFVVADVVAQLLSERQKRDEGGSADDSASSGLDVARIGRVGLFGFLFYGPVSGEWYGFLDNTVLPNAPTSAAAVALKTAADQLLWAPVLVSCLFAWDLVWSGSESEEQGGGLNGLQAKLERDLLATLLVNWTFWPVFHLVNFRLVPPGDRILYVNVVQVFYNVFLCWQAAKRTGSETAGSAVESKRT